MPFSFPLSRADRMSPRPSVLEQSTQDRISVGPFFDPANFPNSQVKPMANNGASDPCQQRPVDGRGPESNATHLPPETTWRGSKRTVSDSKCDERRLIMTVGENVGS